METKQVSFELNIMLKNRIALLNFETDLYRLSKIKLLMATKLHIKKIISDECQIEIFTNNHSFSIPVVEI